MYDRNGKKIWDGDYVTNTVQDGIVCGKNRVAVLVKVMNVDTGHETWVHPNHCTVVEEPESPSNEDVWYDEVVSMSGYRPNGSREW